MMGDIDLNTNAIVFDSRANSVATAGRITETDTTTRQMQFGLKLVF